MFLYNRHKKVLKTDSKIGGVVKGCTVVWFFIIKYGGEAFLDEFFSVWFLLRDCGEVSFERRSVFRMVTISLLPVVAGGWADLGAGWDWSEKYRPHRSSNPGLSN
jgi:hypothetical protein